jgi:endonuclease/exonuclease/phosphatase family metal-dependent hydrolase
MRIPVLPARRSARLRVMSYNIFHAVGQDGKLNLTRTAQVIRNQKVDVVGLQVRALSCSTKPRRLKHMTRSLRQCDSLDRTNSTLA